MEKLSELQQLILVALLEPRYMALKRRQLNSAIKRLYFGKDSRSIRSTLSRSLRRLEERGYIQGFKRGWQLTEMRSEDLLTLSRRMSGQDKVDDGDVARRFDLTNGFTTAVLVWAKRRELYALIGLYGPPPEALGIKPKAKDRPGVKVELDMNG